MKERSIRLYAHEVRAVLEDRQTQMRRAIKPQPYVDEMGNACWNGYNYGQDTSGRPLFKSLASPIPSSRTKRVLCPYGRPGDRLWVRETFGFYFLDEVSCTMPPPVFAADGPKPEMVTHWRPSIHMPRWASRIDLEVTGVRVERLQDISERDATADGGYSPITRDCKVPKFRELWESINGPGSWNANPWVWVVEFQKLNA